MRLTSIVATLGPASSSPEVIEKLIRAGVDVFRLNFSHGSHQEHKRVLDLVRSQAEQASRYVAVLQDLPGPKIRLTDLAGGSVRLETGANVRIVRTLEGPGDASRLASTYPRLIDDLRVGDTVLLADGTVSLGVIEKTDDAVTCRVTMGAEVSSRAGINLPGVTISSPSVTQADFKHLAWGIENDVDYVALSFVRSADDILAVRQFLHARQADIPVVAKIEKPEAIDHLYAIIEAADAVMVARGDLGVEMRLEQVPTLQKRIIHACLRARKPVITATQMLQSMIDSPTPTRAEVSDVANAILDGSDAVMLSGETAVGKYPVQTVHAMARVCSETDSYAAGLRSGRDSVPPVDPAAPVSSSLSASVGRLVDLLHPALVVVSTASGYTARNLSKDLLPVPILALSPDKRVCRRMALLRGIVAHPIETDLSLDEIVKQAEPAIRRHSLAVEGDFFVVVAGFPVGRAGTTNTVHVKRLETPETLVPSLPRHARWTLRDSQHHVFHYAVDYLACIGCGACVRRCPFAIYELVGGHAVVNEQNLPHCIRDRACVRACPTGAITIHESVQPRD